MPLHGVSFDLDGTPVDTHWHHDEASRRASVARACEFPAERIGPEVGKGGDQLVPAIIGADGDKEHGEALRAAHKREFLAIAEREQFAVFPGAVELIETLRSRRLKLALATSSPEKVLKAI